MNTQKEKHLLAKVAAVMLLSFATVGGTYSVQAAGLTGSYVGISAGPKDTDVIDKGAVIPTEDKTWQMKLLIIVRPLILLMLVVLICLEHQKIIMKMVKG